MDIGGISLFTVMKQRLNWLTQRQEVLAQNIANADTPNYRAKDLAPFKFKHLLRHQSKGFGMSTTRVNHLSGGIKSRHGFSEITTRKPYETSPTGNGVVLEEQMMKVNATGMGHKLTTELYKKHLNMIRMAIGRAR